MRHITAYYLDELTPMLLHRKTALSCAATRVPSDDSVSHNHDAFDSFQARGFRCNLTPRSMPLHQGTSTLVLVP
jgi:hypothetical protein